MAKEMYVGVNNFTPRTLPSGYTQIEYIQSSGTQYINTGFNPNQNTTLKMSVAFLGTVGSNIAGVRNTTSDTTNRFGLITFGSASKIGAFFQTSSIQAIAFDNKKHEYSLDKNGLVVDGTTYGSANSGAFACTYPITLFGWNNGSGGVTATASRVYSCQIYDNGTLVRDFVPAMNSSGVAGLYDMVNGTFYTDVAGGTFTAGSVHKSVARQIKKMYVGTENFTPRTLPSGYTQIEYIKSSGTQYINTEFCPNQDTRIVIDVENEGIPSSYSSGFSIPFGARTSTKDSCFAMWIKDAEVYPQYGNVAYNANGKFTVNTVARVKYELNKNVATVNGETITCTAYTFSQSYPLYLLTCNTAGTADARMMIGKLYSCQIYDNGTLVRDLVPAMNSSGVAGLYDMVNGTFYTDAAGGVFTAGSTYKGVARKIKKGYIGDANGIARLFYRLAPTYTLAWHGTLTNLPYYPAWCAAGSVGDYAMIGGGWRCKYSYTSDSTSYSGDDVAYNSELVQTTFTKVSDSATGVECGSFRDKQNIIFAGGTKLSKTKGIAYNTNLVRTEVAGLSTSASDGSTTESVGNYVIFGGRYRDVTTDAYDSNLVLTTITSISDSKYSSYSPMAGHTTDYALFAGGENGPDVVAYNANLVKTTAPDLSADDNTSIARGATVGGGKYVLFNVGSTEPITAIDVYDNNLVKTTAANLNVPSSSNSECPITVDSLGEFGVFMYELTKGGEYYNSNLVKQSITVGSSLGANTSVSSTDLCRCVSTVAGDYMIIMGGCTSGTGSRMNNVRAIKMSEL